MIYGRPKFTIDTVDIVDTVNTVDTVDSVDTVDTILHCVIIHHNRDDVNAMRQCRDAKNPVE